MSSTHEHAALTVPMVLRSELVELAEIARKCRRAQATYFQSRNNGDLRVAKDYERRLDDAIALILDKPKPQQRTLFGGDSR